MSRPLIEIDWVKVNGYLRAHCDGASIARILGINPETLYGKVQKEFKIGFSEYMRQKRGEGVTLVEASMYNDVISKGGVDRIFWLKNKAGWKDKIEIENKNEHNDIDFSDVTDEELKVLTRIGLKKEIKLNAFQRN